MANKAFQNAALSVGTKAAGNYLGSLLGGSSVGGLISGGGIGGALGGLGSAASGALAAMGPVGWAALAAGALYGIAGGHESKLDKLKKSYKKGQKTGDFSRFLDQMNKWEGASSKFIKKFGDPRLDPSSGAYQGGAPGMTPAAGMAPPPMQMFMDQGYPTAMATPSMFARPEAMQLFQQLYGQAGSGQSAPGNQLAMMPNMGGPIKPGPEANPFNNLGQFAAAFGNGGAALGAGQGPGWSTFSPYRPVKGMDTMR